MTDQEINIAIAECCGYEYHKVMHDSSKPGGWDYWTHPFIKHFQEPVKHSVDQLPDYSSDLNAMHEAEKVFDDQPVDTKSMYWDYLCLCSMPEPFPGDDSFLRDYVMIRATARQRAEAFLRTLGKWKE